MIYVRILSDFLFFFFALFAISSTFSIAIAQLSLGVSLLLFLVIMFLKKENPFSGNLKIFYISIGMYFLWMVLASLFGKTPTDSLFILKEEWLFFAIPIGVYVLKKESFRKKIFIYFAIAIGIISLYGIVQHFTGVHWFKSPPIEAFDFGYRVKGFFPHRLTFGNYFATVSMFLLGYLVASWKELSPAFKIFLTVDVILAIIATLFSYSYGPILAIVGTIIILIFISMRSKKLLLVVGSLSVIAFLFYFNPTIRERVTDKVEKETNIENEASRMYIWDNAFKMLKDNPVFGVGQGNFYSQFQENMTGHRIHVHAHNDFLNIAAIAGLPGFLFFSLMWGYFFQTTFKAWKKNEQLIKYKNFFLAGLLGAVAFFISSLTEATFADEEVRQMLMLIFAFGLFPFVTKENKVRN